MLKPFLFLSLLLISIQQSHAQEKLSLKDAIGIALKNNYSILISENQTQIISNNNTPGNAGMLPTLGINAAGNKSVNNVKQNYSTGLEVNKDNVSSNNLTAGVALNWTIFDGFKMFATQNKLQELQSKGDLNLKIEIENTVANVISSYFDVVRNNELLKAMEKAIEIYQERVRISETKYNIGSSSKLNLLQAKVDLNEQRSVQLKEKTALGNSKNNLNQLLGRAIETDFVVTDSIIITYHPNQDELKKTLTARNNTLLSAQKDIRIASYSIKELESLRYPKIGLGAGYNFSRVENNAGLFILNQNAGPTYGFTLTWNIFN
jgi:outer membrane protein